MNFIFAENTIEVNQDHLRLVHHISVKTTVVIVVPEVGNDIDRVSVDPHLGN